MPVARHPLNVEIIDHGRLTVAGEFLPLLKANGLDSFEAVMALPGGKVFRDFPGRRTVRLELATAGGGTQAVFLKRYESSYLTSFRRWLRRVRWPGTEDEALREWRMIQEVGSLGIRTARPVALGQETASRATVRSFLMTAEIPAAVEGISWAERLDALERRRFLLEVSELARRFHAAGLVHKDFYLGHFLVSPAANGPELFLIDLQRATRPCCRLGRWVTKDLGALAYSMYNAGGSRTDLLRCYLAYSGDAGLDDAGKHLVRAVWRRVSWLRTRQPRHGGPVKQRT